MDIGIPLYQYDWRCESSKASILGQGDEQVVYITAIYRGTRKKGPEKAP